MPERFRRRHFFFSALLSACVLVGPSIVRADDVAASADPHATDTAAALDRARASVVDLSKSLGPDDPKVAAGERARALLAGALGVGGEAVDAAEDALRITRLGKAPPFDVAADENALGEALARVGRFGEAERHLTTASSLLDHAPRSVLAATIWSNLGSLALEIGYTQRAKQWLDRAEEALSAPAHDARRALVTVLRRQGDLAKRQWAIGDALRYDGRALSVAIEEYGPDDAEVGRAQAELGAAIVAEGRALDAEPLLRRSVEVLTGRLGADHFDLATPHRLLAECALLEDKPADASAELATTFRIELRRLDSLLGRSRPQDLRRFLETTDDTTWVAVSLALRPNAPTDAVRAALGMVLTRKSLDMDMERAEAHAAHASAEARDVLARLTANRAALARALLQGSPSSDELRALERTDDALELSLGRLTLAGLPTHVRIVDAAAVAKALPVSSALVEVALVKLYPGEGMGGSYRVTAFVVTPDGGVAVRDLGSVEALGLRITSLRTAIKSGQVSDTALRDAYGALVQPWADAVGNATSLFLAPDGPLALVPFEALPRPDGKALVESSAITYLTSGRDLVDLAAPRPLRHDLGSALLVGDPDYDVAPAKGTAPMSPQSLLAGAHWPRLPGTADEVRALSTLLPGATIRLGGDASAAGIAAAAAGARLVHVATHGYFLDTAGALVAKSRGLSLEINRPAVEPPPTRTAVLESLSDHPEIRSGLVFAGVNSGGGYLTAAEVAGIDFSSTDLVVLSACETGVGETSAGLGVTGLRRSLDVAGARSEIISLWKVDDAATAELMKQFYGNVSRGMGRSAALQSAKLSVRAHSEWSAPYFWGAFQLFGDWRAIVDSPTVASPPMKLAPRAGCGACSTAASADESSSEALVAGVLVALVALLRRRKARASYARAVAVVVVLAIGGEASIARADPTPPPPTMADALAIIHRYLQKSMQGDYAKTLTLTDRVLRIEPDNDVVLGSAARTDAALKNFKKARVGFIKAIDAALAVGARFRAQGYAFEMDRLAQSENGDVDKEFKAAAATAGTPQVTRATEDVDALLALGRTALEQGNIAAAFDAANKAEAICQKQLATDAVRLARAQALGGLALAGGGHPEGIERMKSAIAALSATLGKDNVEVLIERGALGNALRALGRVPEAITELESVVADGSRRFGKDGAFVIMARANLIDGYASGGRPQLAIGLAQQTLEPCHQKLGVHSNFCLEILRALASAAYATGNRLAAHDAATRAITEELRMTGIGGSNVLAPQHYAPPPERPEVIAMLTLMVAADLGPGTHDPIDQVRAELIERQRALGRDAVAAMRVEYTVATLELSAGKIDMGVRRMEDMRRRANAAYGAYSPFALEVSMSTSTALASMGRFKEIEALVIETSQRVIAAEGRASELAISARFNEGFVKVQLGRKDGVAIMREAATQAATTLGATNPLTVGMKAQVDALSGK